jgi:hypothetical protein
MKSLLCRVLAEVLPDVRPAGIALPGKEPPAAIPTLPPDPSPARTACVRGATPLPTQGSPGVDPGGHLPPGQRSTIMSKKRIAEGLGLTAKQFASLAGEFELWQVPGPKNRQRWRIRLDTMDPAYRRRFRERTGE